MVYEALYKFKDFGGGAGVYFETFGWSNLGVIVFRIASVKVELPFY